MKFKGFNEAKYSNLTILYTVLIKKSSRKMVLHQMSICKKEKKKKKIDFITITAKQKKKNKQMKMVIDKIIWNLRN